MTTLPWWRLVALAVFSGLGSWIVLALLDRGGAVPVPVPVIVPIVILALAVGVLLAARLVWRSARGRTAKPVHPLTAFRVAVASTAAAYAGPVLAGWYAAQALALWPDLVGDRRARFWSAMAAVVAAAVLTGAGLVGRRLCRPPTSVDDEIGSASTNPSEAE